MDNIKINTMFIYIGIIVCLKYFNFFNIHYKDIYSIITITNHFEIY